MEGTTWRTPHGGHQYTDDRGHNMEWEYHTHRVSKCFTGTPDLMNTFRFFATPVGSSIKAWNRRGLGVLKNRKFWAKKVVFWAFLWFDLIFGRFQIFFDILFCPKQPKNHPNYMVGSKKIQNSRFFTHLESLKVNVFLYIFIKTCGGSN